jgi:hypothetical protein
MTQPKTMNPAAALDGFRIKLNESFEFLALEVPRISGEILAIVEAINASLVSQQGGSGMRGFAAATAELIGIAAQQLRDANLVMGVVSGAKVRFEQLQEAVVGFEQRAQGMDAEPVQDALNQLLGSFRELQNGLADVSSRLAENQAQNSRTMVAIQREDMLRQGLDHVCLIDHERARSSRIVLAYLNGQGRLEDVLEAAMVEQQTSQLCANLLDSISRESAGLLVEVESGLQLLAENTLLSVPKWVSRVLWLTTTDKLR